MCWYFFGDVQGPRNDFIPTNSCTSSISPVAHGVIVHVAPANGKKSSYSNAFVMTLNKPAETCLTSVSSRVATSLILTTPFSISEDPSMIARGIFRSSQYCN